MRNEMAGFRLGRAAIAIRILCGVLWVVCCGCASGEDEPLGLSNLQPVTGKVMFQGQPTPGAIVEFISTGSSLDKVSRFGVVAADGKFEVKTAVPEGTKSGVEPGNYAITVSWTKPLAPHDKDSEPGPDILPLKYKSASSSGLQCEVKSGKNEVPQFELVP